MSIQQQTNILLTATKRLVIDRQHNMIMQNKINRKDAQNIYIIFGFKQSVGQNNIRGNF